MECVSFLYFFFLEGWYHLIFVVTVILRNSRLSRILNYCITIGHEVLLNFLVAFNTFSFIFDFRNGLHWVANVFVIENKTCAYIVTGGSF